MSAIQEIRDLIWAIDYALEDLADEVGEHIGDVDVDAPQEMEIERLRRENLVLRETIRRQNTRLAKLEREHLS